MMKGSILHKPKISVVIPVYNMEAYLAQCLDSVIGQTLREIEIICVNDGSTDTSPEILSVYQKKDERILVITQENAGSGPARNNGMIHGSGEYVAYMDPDDWYPDADILETLYSEAKKNYIRICGGVMSIWDGAYHVGEYKGSTHLTSCQEEGRLNIRDYQISTGYQSYIYDLMWLKLNNIYFPSYKRAQDPVFFVNALVSANEFYRINKVTYCYRVEHKTIHWDIEKNNDYLKHLIDILRLSKENNLEVMHIDRVLRLQLWSLRTWYLRLFQNNMELLDLLAQVNQLVNKELVYSALSSRIIPIALFKTHNYATPFARACTLLSCSFTLFIILCHKNGLNYTLRTIIRKIY